MENKIMEILDKVNEDVIDDLIRWMGEYDEDMVLDDLTESDLIKFSYESDYQDFLLYL